MKKHNKITVIGAGNGGKALAGHLALMGAKVTLYNRTWKHIDAIKERGGISVVSDNGEVQGFGELVNITSNMDEAIIASPLIMIVVPAFAHKDLATKMAPFLHDGQIVVLNPGRTFGAFEFRQVLNSNKCQAKIILAETQTFIYASRSDGPSQARIHRIKDGVPLAALPSRDTHIVLEALRPYFPQFINGRSVLHTGLNNIGAIFHPAITIHNAGRIEDTDGEFQFYLDGVTPTVAAYQWRKAWAWRYTLPVNG
jgi:opine dehydrogenase